MFKKSMMPPRGAVPARYMSRPTPRPMPPAAPDFQLINNRNPLPAGYDASKYTASEKPFYGMKKGGVMRPPARPQTPPVPLPGAGKLLRARSGGVMKDYKEGGSVYRKGADGVASKGKTKGRMI